MLQKDNLRESCGDGTVLIFTASMSISCLWYCIVIWRCYLWGKLDKTYTGSFCIISYNWMWIYNDLALAWIQLWWHRDDTMPLICYYRTVHCKRGKTTKLPIRQVQRVTSQVQGNSANKMDFVPEDATHWTHSLECGEWCRFQLPITKHMRKQESFWS